MKPNIILISVDCWRSDHIGIATDARVKTPCLEALANQSYYYPNAYSCGGWTKIAMTSLFSSTHASMYGFTQGKLSSERPNLPETLLENGYITAGFTSNLVCGRSGGFDRGFQEFHDLKPEIDTHSNEINKRSFFERVKNNSLIKNITQPQPIYPSTKANEIVDKAIEWVAQDHENPYFLWLHFMDLHWPYASSNRELDWFESRQMRLDRESWKNVKNSKGTFYPGDKRSERWKKLYAEETEALDTELGRLFSALKQEEDWDNTALCVTNDHGEELYEHGTWAHSWNQLYREGTQTPLLLKAPNQIKSLVINNHVSQLDIAPTLLSVANISIPEKMLGKSLLDDHTPEPVFIEMLGHANSHRYRLSIRTEEHHYIYDADNDRCYLYSMAKDRNSLENIYSHECPISKHFNALRLNHITRGALDFLRKGEIVGEDEFSFAMDEDPMVIQRLKALGYVE